MSRNQTFAVPGTIIPMAGHHLHGIFQTKTIVVDWQSGGELGLLFGNRPASRLCQLGYTLWYRGARHHQPHSQSASHQSLHLNHLTKVFCVNQRSPFESKLSSYQSPLFAIRIRTFFLIKVYSLYNQSAFDQKTSFQSLYPFWSTIFFLDQNFFCLKTLFYCLLFYINNLHV